LFLKLKEGPKMKKKLATVALAAALLLVVTGPALAFENEFGGYFRARAFSQQKFTGVDGQDQLNTSRADQRTRLFYTALFSDEFKFVNKFEMNAIWGDESERSYGGIATDGYSVKVKNSYVDFTVGEMNFKVGAQGKTWARGFLFDDDFAGVIAAYRSPNVTVPLIWIRAYENGPGRDDSKGDVDYIGIDPRIKLAEKIWLNPLVMYAYSDDAQNWAATTANQDIQVYFVGVNADLDFDVVSLWLTAIYEGGTTRLTPEAKSSLEAEFGQSFNSNQKVDAWMAAAGANFPLPGSPISLHSQAFYLSGDHNPTDNQAGAFFVPKGQAYYWSEIMGCGIFDNQKPAGVPGSSSYDADNLTNIWAINLGVTYPVTDKLTVTLDGWYAEIAQDRAYGNLPGLADPSVTKPKGDGYWELGKELDLRVTYRVIENLTLDLVGAYLWAGDAMYSPLYGTKNNENIYEFGTQLSFRF
jgi:hypothetical protein